LGVQGGAFWVGPLLRKVAYDLIKDFSPTSLLVREVNVQALSRVANSICKRFDCTCSSESCQEVVRYLNRPEVKEPLLKNGVEMVGSSPEQFADALKSDMTKMSKLIKDIGLKVEK